LCASRASEAIPDEVEHFVRDVCRYICGSPKRKEKLRAFQEELLESSRRVLKWSATRWLSKAAVIKRILELWEPLTAFFDSEAEDATSGEHRKLAGALAQALRIADIRCYLAFFNRVLPKVTAMNELFQSESLKIHELLPRSKTLFSSIAKDVLDSTYMLVTPVEEYQFSPSNFRKLPDVYIGAVPEKIISEMKVPPVSEKKIRISIQNFLVALCQQIMLRINFRDPVLCAISSVLDPETALSGKIQSVVPLVSKLSQKLVPTDTDLEALNDEYQMLPLAKKELASEDLVDPVKFWVKMSLDGRYNTIAKFAFDLMCLPHSSAAAERAFSMVNLMKTKARNRMGTAVMNSLLGTKMYLKLRKTSCYNFKAPDSLVGKARVAWKEFEATKLKNAASLAEESDVDDDVMIIDDVDELEIP
jgi:hypothetical protein